LSQGLQEDNAVNMDHHQKLLLCINDTQSHKKRKKKKKKSTRGDKYEYLKKLIKIKII
jgi:hypothetical protein